MFLYLEWLGNKKIHYIWIPQISCFIYQHTNGYFDNDYSFVCPLREKSEKDRLGERRDQEIKQRPKTDIEGNFKSN